MVSQIIHYIRQKKVLLKNTLILLFLVFNAIASATDYYISSSGNDLNNGLSSSTPWKTITKVNAAFSILKPGDRILFNRGDTFYGTITITKSGIAGNPITIGAYGTGANPVITGFTTISGWTNEGNGIYSKVMTSEAQTNMVTVDGVNTGMGRYPKSTYLTYESFSTNVSITDNGLGDATNWTGAEAVIRKNDWTLDRCTITKHIGDVLTYTSLGTNLNATANYGYFIQNDLRCVTSYGEWYHNASTGKFYMFFGLVDPSTKVVKVATLDNLIYNNTGLDYITINNVSLTGSIGNSIEFSWGSDYCNVQNCSVTFAGEDGMRFSGSYGIIDNNYISNCNRTGIGTFYSGTNNVITNNAVTNTGIVKGQSKSIPGIWSPTCGIAVESNNSLIQYNTIENTGYTGIQIAGNADIVIVKNNFIRSTCLVLNDGGGIYTGGPHTSIIIDGNAILNSMGNTDGTTKSNTLAEGIYLDQYASNVTVRNNTIANCSNDGIKLHKAHDNIIQNNIAFNNSNGIGFENWSGVSAIYNNTLNGNIFFAKEPIQFALSFTTTVNEIPGFGTADNNYYARPIDDNYVINTNQPSTGSKNRTLADWQSFTKQDANSHKSPITLTNNNEIRFEYNASKTNKVIILDQPMVDVKGTKYVNSTTLLPFTSVVLMVDPDPAQPVIPVYTGSVIENATPSLLEMTYNVSLANILPLASAFTVHVNSVVRILNSVVISGTKVQLTLASAVVYGDIVTLTYTKPSSNPLQTALGGQAITISAQPVVNNCINAANMHPIVIISNPSKGNKYENPATIDIDVFATDPDGTISKVVLYNGSNKLVELTSAPYSYTWKDVNAGTYTITAIATDNLNAATTSSSIEFTVENVSRYDANSKIINLYPNPNDGHFSIEFINPLQNEKSEIVITDLAGKQVYNGLISKEETLKQFDLSYIKSGIYILMIFYKEILVTKKFIIQ